MAFSDNRAESDLPKTIHLACSAVIYRDLGSYYQDAINKLILQIGGLHPNEIKVLRWSDINEATGRFRVFNAKMRLNKRLYEREIPLFPEIRRNWTSYDWVTKTRNLLLIVLRMIGSGSLTGFPSVQGLSKFLDLLIT